MKPIIPDAALQQHVAVLGKTRSGKSSVMRGLVEGILDREQPVCIIDPKGDWWGIKLAKDGKRPGYPVVIFGGEHADVPINAHAGAHVAELFATGNRPCLIDLGGWMVGERTRFYIDFASTLFRLTRGMRWLVIDEIHNFAPKGKVMDPDAGKALHWTNRLASEGLGKGLPMLFASQRPQKVHNDTLTSAETLIAMRVLHPSDRGAVSDWIKGCGDLELGAKVLNSLAQMDRGEGWVWSPEIGLGPVRVKFPMFKTYDSFRPQSAEDTAALKGWAAVDLDEVKAKLAVVVKEAEENDPKALKARIRELEAEREAERKHPLHAIDQKAIDQAEARGYARGKAYGIAAGESSAVEKLQQLVAPFEAATERLRERLSGLRVSAANAMDKMDVAEMAPPPFRQPSVERPSPVGHGAGSPEVGTGGLRRILIALAQRPQGLTARQLGVRAGLSSRSGTFATYLSKGRSEGWILGSGQQALRITDAGLKALGTYEPLPTGSALREYWLGELDGGAMRILAGLCDAYPRSVGREDAATRAGLSAASGTFATYLSKLRTLELISGSKELKASDELFD